MNIHEFKKKFDELYKMICSGHNIEEKINFSIYGEEEDTRLTIKDIEIDYLPGCRCEIGINIIFKELE